jgi:uncharacterized protein
VGKVLFWIVVIFAVLFALRLYNASKAKRRRDATRESARSKTAATGDPMVRCARCGVFLPKADATAVSAGYVCTDPACLRRG